MTQAQKIAKALITSTPIEVGRLAEDAIYIQMPTYDAIDGPYAEHKKAKAQMKALCDLVISMGYKATIEGYGVIIDTFGADSPIEII